MNMITDFVRGKEKNLWIIGVLISFAILAKFLGFIRNAVIAYYFGTSYISDTLNLLLYPTELILSFVVNNTIITALTSFYGLSTLEKEKTFWKIVHFYEIALIVVALGIVGMMSVTYSGLDPIFLIVGAIAATFYGISGIIQSFLNYKLRFYSSAIQDLVSQILLIAGIVATYFLGIAGFALFILLSGLLRILVQVPELLKVLDVKISLREIFPGKNSFDPQIIKYILPLVFSFFLSNIPSFIILALLQKTGSGYISAYNYAIKVITLFNPIIVVPFTTYVIPKLQNIVEDDKKAIVNKLHSFALIVIGITSILVTVIFWFFSTPIAKMLYFRGNFDGEALTLTASMLQWLSFTIIGFAMMYYLLQVILMQKRNKLVFLSYIVGTIISVAILFFQIEPIQIRISISLTMGTLVSTGILLFPLQRTYRQYQK